MANRLTELRTKKGLTQQQLADAVGVSKVQISRMENGESVPKNEILRQMVDELGQEVQEIFPDITPPPRWTTSELEAAVKAYCEQLAESSKGESVNKAEQIRRLQQGALGKRTRASIEYRMQNISAVVQEMGQAPLQGYAPARNVGSKVKEEIRNLLEAQGIEPVVDGSPVAERDELERRSELLRKQLRKHPIPDGPVGVRRPKTVTITISTILRDPLIRAWVLENAGDRCEVCGEPAPFKRPDGTPYLEVHHVKKLADGGPDTTDNTVACCSNCHSELHKGSRSEELRERLYETIKRLKRY